MGEEAARKKWGKSGGKGEENTGKKREERKGGKRK